MRTLIRVPFLLGTVALLLIAIAAVIFVSGDTVLGQQQDNVVVDDGKIAVPEASVSVEQAIQIALAHVNGKIDDVDVKGHGDDMVYKIEVGDTDVVIDATDGTVIKIDPDDDDDQKQSGKSEQAAGIISPDEAIAIARTVAEGTVYEVELDEDDGRLEYEIEIGAYEVEIDARTGEILDVDHDDDDGHKSGNADIISSEEAIAIARTVAEGTVHEVELDEDDGRLEYEVEIGAYEVEIDAHTGEILDIDHDDDDDDYKRSDASGNADIISHEEAIAIARTVAEGHVHEIELDEDDGRLEYEIEIGNYEVEIDAHTGEILDVEYDD